MRNIEWHLEPHTDLLLYYMNMHNFKVTKKILAKRKEKWLDRLNR